MSTVLSNITNLPAGASKRKKQLSDDEYEPNNTSLGSDHAAFSPDGSTVTGGSAPKPQRKKKAKSSSPKFQPSAEEALRLLRILNEGTLAEILDLYGIGGKKASLILVKRGSKRLESVTNMLSVSVRVVALTCLTVGRAQGLRLRPSGTRQLLEAQCKRTRSDRGVRVSERCPRPTSHIVITLSTRTCHRISLPAKCEDSTKYRSKRDLTGSWQRLRPACASSHRRRYSCRKPCSPEYISQTDSQEASYQSQKVNSAP
jgi:hypothetical protein